MNHLTKDYVWYTDVPGHRFEYATPCNIWLINPKTKKWAFELYCNGNLWCNDDLYYKFRRDFRLYFNLELDHFEWFLKLWVEDAVNRVVEKIRTIKTDATEEVEDVLNQGKELK